MLESGLTPSAVGDEGCSKGILQINGCVHGAIPGTDEQIDRWLAKFKQEYERSGKWELSVVSWNWPAMAQKGIWQTQYFYKYKKILSQIEGA